jgi:hypothetical protein
MPEFEVAFREKGRLKRRKRAVFDEAELLEWLACEGIAAESIKQLVPRPATDPQLAYLADLKVRVTRPLTLDEASDLISNAKKGREPADAQTREVARKMRVEVTDFASKSKIYYLVLDKVRQGPVKDLARWYVYRLYRAEFNKGRIGGLDDPFDPMFDSIADAICANPQLVSSLKRAASSSSNAWRWFGEYKSPDGELHNGESRRTAVYSYVRDGLKAAGAEKTIGHKPGLFQSFKGTRADASGRSEADSDQYAGLPDGERRPRRWRWWMFWAALALLVVVSLA